MIAMTVSGGEVAAWIAAVAGFIALANQAWTAVKKRKKERNEVREALDHSPEVRHQLELGNVGEAVKHLNFIMESQATYIQDQDRRLATNVREIERLHSREEALEAEAEGWQNRYVELEREFEAYKASTTRRIHELEVEVHELSDALEEIKDQGEPHDRP